MLEGFWEGFGGQHGRKIEIWDVFWNMLFEALIFLGKVLGGVWRLLASLGSPFGVIFGTFPAMGRQSDDIWRI